MKKIVSLCMLLCCGIVLSACGNGNEEQVSEQEKTIESLREENTQQSKTIDTLQSQQESEEQIKDNMTTLKKGETITLSGTVIVGTDFDAGTYDVSLPESDKKEGGFKLYKDQNAMDDNDWDFEALFNDEELKSFILRDGNILEFTENMNFTKIK